MNARPFFSKQDHQTWKILFSRQSPLRDQQMIPEFGQGLSLLNMTEDGIPDLEEVNKRLMQISGWQGVYTNGLVEAGDFFDLLSLRKFPIGAFIRDSKDLSYTPAPDVFHDLYGHIPFYTIPAYAEFCQRFGECAKKYSHSKNVTEEFQRLFWFAIEFGLVKTKKGIKIFGAGIASSFAECAFALSNKPKVIPFDLEKIRGQDFRIDIMQEKLFLMDSPLQLYSSLDLFESPYIEGFI